MDTLEQLLEWAKNLKMYIEIRGNGSAEVHFDPGFDGAYESYTVGTDLLSALKNAHDRFLKCV